MMNLQYKCFGRGATLIRYKRIEVEGERFEVVCTDAIRCRVFSESEKKAYLFEMDGGACDIPTAIIEGGAAVSFELSDGSTVQGTPLKLQRVGGGLYICGSEFSTREEIERLNDALCYISDVVKNAIEKANRVDELEKRLESLEKKAHSGDIIK